MGRLTRLIPDSLKLLKWKKPPAVGRWGREDLSRLAVVLRVRRRVICTLAPQQLGIAAVLQPALGFDRMHHLLRSAAAFRQSRSRPETSTGRPRAGRACGSRQWSAGGSNCLLLPAGRRLCNHTDTDTEGRKAERQAAGMQGGDLVRLAQHPRRVLGLEFEH